MRGKEERVKGTGGVFDREFWAQYVVSKHNQQVEAGSTTAPPKLLRCISQKKPLGRLLKSLFWKSAQN